MDTNKILSADFLDILFDNRNKSYGAYELRRTYSKRVGLSLLLTGIIVTLLYAGIALIDRPEPKERPVVKIHEGVIVETLTIDKPKEKLETETPRKAEPKPKQQVQTEQYTKYRLTDEDLITAPPTLAEINKAQIGLANIEGIINDRVIEIPAGNHTNGIIADKVVENAGPLSIVQVQAKFDGDWKKFLERNLNPRVAIDNNAPPGIYTVMIQFVVDTDGSISDIKALNNPGYGLGEEAIRVIKKSKKWEPAIQEGRPAKAYRKQPITFQITDDYQ
ncbi:MAG TPA: TonB family protein [Chitinophagaceae bacterium]|nr:TonB family protein [Chitinophagaceae bacterium]